MREKAYYILVGAWGIIVIGLMISMMIFVSLGDYQSALYCGYINFPIFCLGFGIPLISPWGI